MRLRLGVLGVDADVADVRIGERDDLAGVRRIGEDLLVAGHRGVEHDLADGLAERADRAAAEHRAVGEREDRRRARGEERGARSWRRVVGPAERRRSAGPDVRSGSARALPARSRQGIEFYRNRPRPAIGAGAFRRGPARRACRRGRCGARARRAATKRTARSAPSANMPARRRAVRDLDALALAGEHDDVLADDVAAAQRREADRARLALAGRALARVDAARSPRSMPAPVGGGLAQHQRGPRRRVDLVPVVHLDDLDVVAVARARAPRVRRGRRAR